MDRRETLRQRLRERLDAVGKTAHAVSREIGTNAGYVRDLLDPEKSSIPSATRLQALAGALGTTTDYLIGDAAEAGQPLSEVSFREAPRPWREASDDRIPVLGTAYCDDLAVEAPGGGELQVERLLLETDHTVSLIARPPALWNAKDAYAIYFHGSSMEPRFYQGEVGIVDPRRPPGPGDFVVVQLGENGGGDDVVTVLVKQLVRTGGGFVELGQFNPPLTFRVPRAQVKRLHRIATPTELLAY